MVRALGTITVGPTVWPIVETAVDTTVGTAVDSTVGIGVETPVHAAAGTTVVDTTVRWTPQ